MSGKVWFITGTSRGFGREWALAALERGDRVAATARNTDSLKDLTEKYGDAVLPIALDVTDRDAAFAAVAQAHERFGALDIVINNAGYGLFGMIEEVSADDARAQLETNLFGTLWVTQAAVPILRAQGGGHILQVSSIGGVFSLPNTGLYNASKYAVEGFTASLVHEVKDFGIKVTLIEPAGYDTDWAGSSAIRSPELPVYDGFRANSALRPSSKRADPQATREAILAVVDAEEPPLRIFFGHGPLDLMRRVYPAQIAEWERWEAVSEAASSA